eukprot:613092-Pelagomonas_calceolata.AAC.1
MAALLHVTSSYWFLLLVLGLELFKFGLGGCRQTQDSRRFPYLMFGPIAECCALSLAKWQWFWECKLFQSLSRGILVSGLPQHALVCHLFGCVHSATCQGGCGCGQSRLFQPLPRSALGGGAGPHCTKAPVDRQHL